MTIEQLKWRVKGGLKCLTLKPVLIVQKNFQVSTLIKSFVLELALPKAELEKKQNLWKENALRVTKHFSFIRAESKEKEEVMLPPSALANVRKNLINVIQISGQNSLRAMFLLTSLVIIRYMQTAKNVALKICTCANIDSLWRNISDAILRRTKMFITKMGYGMTTELKTLSFGLNRSLLASA
jgi:hypothetical protein